MKLLDMQAAICAAIFLLAFPCEAKSAHNHGLSHLDVLGKRHSLKRSQASARVEGIEDGLQKRSSCDFPTNAGLVAVTPNAKNRGWAMSPDQECVPDSFCPFACPSGQVMAQWNPDAKNYPDPKSMDGGLYCNRAGEISKPFPNDPYCVDGTGALGALNKCGSVVSFCQTVLPGNEAMIIPTRVDDWAQLAVPGPSYWLGTSAHYYINPPGIGTDEACIWGDGTDPKGNWAPFVGGGKTDADGRSWTMIGWNPIFLESYHAKTPPTFGVKIVCNGDCPGTPCSIDPSSDGVGGVTSGQQATGAGGANFCVVTVPSGVTANIVVFPAGNSAGGSGGRPASSSTTTSSTAASSSTTTSAAPSTTSSTTTTTTKPKSKASATATLSESSSNTTSTSAAANSPHILFENNNITSSADSAATTTGGATTSNTALPAASTSKKSEATSVSSSIFGLLIVFVAAAYML